MSSLRIALPLVFLVGLWLGAEALPAKEHPHAVNIIPTITFEPNNIPLAELFETADGTTRQSIQWCSFYLRRDIIDITLNGELPDRAALKYSNCVEALQNYCPSETSYIQQLCRIIAS